ncbi:MAG: hypothetical protein K5855_03455 [Oscillospiraceae bacterium]|jgi:hypothetical protein|nr:hypothetical protein [Oscillospiraceae bacterium]
MKNIKTVLKLLALAAVIAAAVAAVIYYWDTIKDKFNELRLRMKNCRFFECCGSGDLGDFEDLDL